MSWPDQMRQDRRRTSRLVLWAALTLLALLTSCSSGQSPDRFSGRPGIEVHSTERYSLVMLQDTAALTTCEPTGEASNTAVEDNMISGHAFHADGQPIAEVCIRIVLESDGAVRQTMTGADGAYSYNVPAGDYQILAEYNPNDEPGGGAYLEPVSGDGSVTVPPTPAVVDFTLP
jgi:Carboxypeptidase regulatory-like domain